MNKINKTYQKTLIRLYQESDYETIIKNNNISGASSIPLLAIPTTSGSGAEATHFSVVYIGKVKYSVADKSILADMVYLSSEFTHSASEYLTAYTGLDAFSQAIESVWSVNANEESISDGLKAIELIWRNLVKAVKNNDKKAKSYV